eukprot:COSAG05_NODE_406_length_10149_cov_13.684478_9_plen_99_part_00
MESESAHEEAASSFTGARTVAAWFLLDSCLLDVCWISALNLRVRAAGAPIYIIYACIRIRLSSRMYFDTLSLLLIINSRFRRVCVVYLFLLHERQTPS